MCTVHSRSIQAKLSYERDQVLKLKGRTVECVDNIIMASGTLCQAPVPRSRRGDYAHVQSEL